MKYITFEELERKLRGRLKIVEFQENPLYPNQSLQQEVDPDLVEQVIEEQEALVDLVLGQVYVMPLNNTDPTTQAILRDLVTSLVLAELLKVYFQGSGLSSVGHDLSGAGVSAKNEAYEKLNMLVQGYQVYLPGQAMNVNQRSLNEYRRIELPGEVFRTKAPNRIPVNNQTIILDMKGKYNKNENPFGTDYTQRWR